MKSSRLEVGKVINTHGVRGELKVESWCNYPEDLCEIPTIYIANKPYEITTARLHGNFLLLTLAGVNDMDAALALKNRIIEAERSDIPMEEGEHFVVDLIGLEARDAETGAVLGKVTDVLEYPAQDLYVVDGAKHYLIPDVPAFVKGIYLEEGYIAFSPLEGMEQ